MWRMWSDATNITKYVPTLRGLKFFPEKIRGLKSRSRNLRGLKKMACPKKNAPGGYTPLKCLPPKSNLLFERRGLDHRHPLDGIFVIPLR